MNLLNVIDRIAEEKLPPFVAPIVDAERVEVFTLSESGTPYTFTVQGDAGWYLIEPQGKRAHIARDAYPFEVLRYLDALPRFYTIALFRLAERVWVCIPYNVSDAEQRGWMNGVPRVLHLVTDSLRAFDVVDARSLMGTLLYNTVSTRVPTQGHALRNAIANDEAHPDFGGSFRIAYDIVRGRREELRREAQMRALREQRMTTEGKIRYHLQYVNAELKSWSEEGDGYRVQWTYKGKEFEARLRKDLHAVSAGVPGRAICLGHHGEEQRQNLSSIVVTLEQACKLKRFDLPRDYWED